jgi:hypothetical protein
MLILKKMNPENRNTEGPHFDPYYFYVVEDEHGKPIGGVTSLEIVLDCSEHIVPEVRMRRAELKDGQLVYKTDVLKCADLSFAASIVAPTSDSTTVEPTL